MKEDLGVIMSKNTESHLNVGRNEYVTSASLLTFHDDKIEESDKQGIVTNIKFEAIVTSIKKTSLVSAWLIFE